MAEKDKLAKVVANLEARLKESVFGLEESELQVVEEREDNKELEEELTMYKKEDVEKHEKRGFKRPSRRLCSSPRTLTWVFLILSRM